MARSHVGLIVALALAGAGSFFSDRIDGYVLEVLLTIGVNVTLAVSLNLVTGYTGQFSLGHAGFMAIGAYTAAALTMFAGPALLERAGENAATTNGLFLLALLAGGLAAALAGLLVGIPSLRLRGDYLALVTLGFGEIVRVLLRNVEPLGGALGLSGIPPYTTFFWVFGVAALTIYVVAGLVNSTYGRGFIATADDEIAAEAMGLNTTKFKIAAFVIGAFFAGIAGGLYGHQRMFIDPRTFGFEKSIEIVVMVVLGGMGRMTGVILAAILLTLLPEGLRELKNLPFLPTGWGKWIENRMIFYALFLIAVMLLRPQGLFTFDVRKLFRRKPAA